jgi:hypothetical protein
MARQRICEFQPFTSLDSQRVHCGYEVTGSKYLCGYEGIGSKYLCGYEGTGSKYFHSATGS